MPAELTTFVIDDDDMVRQVLKDLLESDGLAVETFATGVEFLAGYSSDRKGCALVDVRMPDMSGLELQDELVSRRSTLPIILITGFGDIETAVTAMKSGAVDFIEKPFKRQVILDSVRRALAISSEAADASEGAGEIADRLETLTRRERDVLDHLLLGKPNKVIAHELGISVRTVESHRARLMDKMAADNLSHLVRMCLTAGVGRAPSVS